MGRMPPPSPNGTWRLRGPAPGPGCYGAARPLEFAGSRADVRTAGVTPDTGGAALVRLHSDLRSTPAVATHRTSCISAAPCGYSALASSVGQNESEQAPPSAGQINA